MLRRLPFANFLGFRTYREKGILVAPKQMLLIPGFETVLKGLTYNSALSVNIWNNESNKMELSSRGGESQGVTEFYVCNCMCSEW